VLRAPEAEADLPNVELRPEFLPDFVGAAATAMPDTAPAVGGAKAFWKGCWTAPTPPAFAFATCAASAARAACAACAACIACAACAAELAP
jgi:hypothetical protein